MLPNCYFHLMTAYDILLDAAASGLGLGKRDFIGM